MTDWRTWLSVEDPFWRFHVQALVILAAAYFVSHIVHVIVLIVKKRITSRTETDLDDRIMVVVERSAKQIVFVSGLYLAAHRLLHAYEGPWAVYVDGVFFVIVVLFVVAFLSGVVRVVMEWYVASISIRTSSPVDDELVPLVKRITNLLLYSIALAVCLDHFHVDIKALVVSLGVGSFAIAFAAQETLANMIAGFVIMIDRPFRVGDRIKISSSGQVGDIIKIGLRSTQILDFDYNVVTIPNADIIKNDIINYNYPEAASRIKIEIGVAYGSDVARVKHLLENICAEYENILKDPKPAAYLASFGDSALNMVLVARAAHYKDVWEISDQLRMRIAEVFQKEGIEIPFPQRVVRLKQPKE